MSEASKRAQKKYDKLHKDQFKRFDLKVSRKSYEKEISFLEALPSRQKFLMWLVSEYMNNSELQNKWREKDG